ncbi:peptidase M23B [Psychromonas ingrahamii 37]|uniref:Peptidase M23B n=1 Tax=Psychromonas ingrahamii (strain DSM 17664 / CCUG 51855 / 37) TaxID=357804 RepID=A1SV37_PSYIN|nr:M23 family metallopeptidase [Psychromonas ingrahamii]ABM03352.1 peptidase M23B [Psychromonas ingrahamii 37]
MKDKSIITISTINGTRGFHLAPWHFKTFKIVSALIVFFFLALTINLFELSDKMDQVTLSENQLISQANKLQHQLISQENTLQGTITDLSDEKLELKQDINQRDSMLDKFYTRLNNLENYLEGDSSLNDTKQNLGASESIDSRLNAATINSALRINFLRNVPNGSPVKKARLSSQFGYRTHPVTKKRKKHRGLDFAVNTGTPIYATADGVVEMARKSNLGSGNFLRIQHSHGFSSSFSHMKSFKAHSGQFVEKGQLIGYSGNTGMSSGPHLHYEIRFVGRALDPLNFVRWNNDNFDTIYEKEKGIKWDYLVQKQEQQINIQLQLLSQLDAALLVQSN